VSEEPAPIEHARVRAASIHQAAERNCLINLRP
jgi:hypothetical protein